MSTAITRQIVLDTETTGMNQIGAHYEGHKIIEIGAVEVINRRLTGNNFHVYLKPDRLVDPEALAYTVLPMSFCWISRFLLMWSMSFLIISAARSWSSITHRSISALWIMSLVCLNAIFLKPILSAKLPIAALARKMFPGKRNSLDALCSRYEIDNSKRTLHGALLDAQILAEVYLAMTGGQTSMTFAMEGETQRQQGEATIQRIVRRASRLRVVFASEEELAAHESRLDLVQKKGGSCLWRA